MPDKINAAALNTAVPVAMTARQVPRGIIYVDFASVYLVSRLSQHMDICFDFCMAWFHSSDHSI